MLITHALALSANHVFYPRKSPEEYVHSMRINPPKMVFVGTRTTHQATGDAGYGKVYLDDISPKAPFSSCMPLRHGLEKVGPEIHVKGGVTFQ